MANLHKGDVGTFLRWTVHDDAGNITDVSSATVTKQARIVKPDGVTHVTGALAFSTKATDKGTGVDGRVEYKVVAGDLDQKGTYSWQLYFVLTTWSGFVGQGTFLVEDVLF